ncbi:Helicase conserved C-terminal domain-containing protein [Nocardioides scoriae]|uniref:Helicase conserved C-terminal domain-containing protein n=1 Tax=Nocardioides scoriae TaxID=642780 RepID=A0A1H1V1F6_9ACTN|nr:Helicase conserved C-terminal domain-containing protein [Nocardioides scoriae]
MMEEEVDDPDSAESGGAGGADASFDPAVALSHMRYPSTMGMTFAVDPGLVPHVVVEVEAARYREAEDGDGTWDRVAVSPDPVRVDTGIVDRRTHHLAEDLDLLVVVREPRGGTSSVTCVLLNVGVPEKNARKDAHCWFQPSITARVDEGSFSARRAESSAGLDDEDLDSYALLFRDVEDMAVGHGCAVKWSDDGPTKELATTFTPSYDVPLAEPAGGSGIVMRMDELATGGVEPLVALVASYRDWITEREGEIATLAPELQATGRRHLADAAQAADRMERGIERMGADPDAERAFRLMNAAMALQRTRQDRQRGIEERPQTWRPFQMAFILLNLEGLIDPTSPDREIADLLWFPTGGGKTEAYLGLIGFSILLRRLRNPAHGGVSVIMRYTLRLLTIQQFERAAGLICALESIRREQMKNAEPISLGLWVGRGATPLKVSEARRALNKLRDGINPKDEGNPYQLLHCPVCGHDLGLDDYLIKKSPDRMVVRCGGAACEFADGLPVHLVDEDVYRERPSLVIGTVDKFAMMAWREQVRSLFSRDGANPPPDLIVQDELHLISGPLGTMVGLYEAAVDAACTGIARPKVVASTATIRRAKKQVRAVFDRDSRQFPPPGLDNTDSYFSVQASPDKKGTRRYLGIAAPSTSHTTLMVRTYAALLQAAQDLPGDEKVRDAYWTLLGYFNSLRVLGGAYMQVLDDVPDRLKVLAGRMGTDVREIPEPGELTSRVDSAEIPEALASLSRALPDTETQDVVLATNMISVGLDVDRLGLMVVMGQPQATAEYIQSTSRVGRQHPGLVVVLYNAARSRDLSHYESFGSYHRALYRQVEATSATPFAARARDRGLHGVLVSYARLLVDGLASDGAAGAIKTQRSALESALQSFLDRAHSIAPDEVDKVRSQMTALIEAWADAADAGSLKYPGWRESSGFLLVDPGMVLNEDELVFPVSDPAWATMTSLREVDATTALFLVPPTKGSKS